MLCTHDEKLGQIVRLIYTIHSRTCYVMYIYVRIYTRMLTRNWYGKHFATQTVRWDIVQRLCKK